MNSKSPPSATETPDAVAISFAIPEDLSDAFAFVPGQYLTLRAEVGGRDMRRSYSICSPRARKTAAPSASSASRTAAFRLRPDAQTRRPHRGDAAAGPLHRRDRRQP
jgi:hypothetical protein